MNEHNHHEGTPVQLSSLPTTDTHTPAVAVHTPPEAKARRDMSALYVPLSIIVAALIIGGGLYFGLAAKGSSTAQGNTQGQQPSANTNIKDVKVDGHPFIGKGNAPVVMAYWYDYQCPFCKAFDTGGIPQITTPAALPDLIKNYVNTGKLKIVFFDYPFLGNDSMDAAEYAHAIWDLYPNQFFAWHEAMFKAQDAEGDQGFGKASTIDQLIKSSFPQMDSAKIKAQVASKKADYDKAIAGDRSQGSAQGVNGTPGFVIGTTLISGADAYTAFTAAIDPLVK